MTDIFCPVCGKSNPASAENCQFCQAPLKTTAFTPSFDESSDLPDWLRSLNTEQSAFPVSGPSEEAPGVPDWLSNIRGAAEEEQPAEAPAEPAQEQPDWLGGVGQGEPGEALSADLPDWLKDQAPSAAAPLAGEDQPAETPAEPAQEQPDWLAELGRGEPGEALSAGLPDWLSEAAPSAAVPLAEEEQPVEKPAEPGQEQPDWLTDLTKAAPVEPASSGGLPDWLADQALSSAALFAEEEKPAGAPAEPAKEQPDWLADLGKGEQAAPFSTDLPDWLGEQQAPVSTTPFEGEEQDWAASWMAGEQKEATTEAAGEEFPASLPAFTFDAFETPERTAPGEGEAEATGDLLSTLPDWVANVTAEETETEGAEGEAELAPAQLPSWLEAMRPTEGEQLPTTAPPEDLSGFKAESSGPLIGLRGVLAAEPMSIRTRRAAAYSIKLRVTDEQKQRVALLEQLLGDEPKPKALPAAPVITAQYVFRLVIALALLLPVLWAVASNGRLTPLPDATAAPGVMATYNLVQRLPAEAAVLVAFDYEAGYSGEMDTAASGVLGHILDRGSSLAVVSTSATGAALAERFIANLNEQPAHLSAPYTNYANLGYIPGGTIGLHSLAQSLHSTLPYNLQGDDVWVSGPLSKVKALSDFDLVLVLVSDPETARAWVEQTGAVLKEGGSALAMIASAQTAPMVQPYFAGYPRQVEGLIAGMAGGAAYEDITTASGTARQTWDAFSLGLMVSVLVILVGTAVDMSFKAVRVGMKGK